MGQNTNLITFAYNGSNITFSNSKGDGVMVNATEMAKLFDKQPIDWLRTQASKDFMAEFSKLKKFSLADLVRVTKGGNAPGTWMHEDVALEFARWLSPSFSIWCNDRIKELLLTGNASLPSYQIEDPIKRAEKWIEEQKERLMLESKNAEMRPKADYFDRLVDRNLLTNIRDTAKQIGLQQNAFVKLLLAGKFLYRDAKGCLKPFAAYADRYFRLKDFERNGHTASQVLVTPEGKEAFALLFGKF